MADLLYFNPKKNVSATDHIIFKLLPKNKEEGWKADKAEELLDPMQLLYYYGYVIAYGVFDLLPEHHKESILNLIDAGIMDDIIAFYAPDFTSSYVTKGKFYYKKKEVPLPKGYTPRMRYVDENGYILVDSVDQGGKIRVFRFIEEDYAWEEWGEVIEE